MVTLYVAGKPAGTLDDAARMLAGFLGPGQRVEFRDDAGAVIGAHPDQPEAGPKTPLVPWDPTITQADLDRIAAEPGYTFEEVKQRLGWK